MTTRLQTKPTLALRAVGLLRLASGHGSEDPHVGILLCGYLLDLRAEHVEDLSPVVRPSETPDLAL